MILYNKIIDNNQAIGDPVLFIREYDLHAILIKKLAEKDNLKEFEVFRNTLFVNQIIEEIKEKSIDL